MEAERAMFMDNVVPPSNIVTPSMALGGSIDLETGTCASVPYSAVASGIAPPEYDCSSGFCNKEFQDINRNYELSRVAEEGLHDPQEDRSDFIDPSCFLGMVEELQYHEPGRNSFDCSPAECAIQFDGEGDYISVGSALSA
jgi:hypothetical protein